MVKEILHDFYVKKQLDFGIAAYHGRKSVVRYLAENCRQSIHYLANFKHGNSVFQVSPLAMATIQGHISCTDLFLDNPSTDWRVKVNGIGNLIHLAIFFQQNDLLKRFLTLYYNKFTSLLEERNDQGQTPLMLASYIGNENAIRQLVKSKALLDAVDDKGNTALHWAVLGEQRNTVTLLIKSEANFYICNQNQLDPMGLARSSESTLFNYLANIRNAKGICDQQKDEIFKPRVLVFKGGGIKGIGHGGAVQGLEEYDMMESVKFVAGTSAGSLIGGLVALRYKSSEIIKIFKEVNFMDLFDFPGRDAIFNPAYKNSFNLMKTIATSFMTTPIRRRSQVVQALWNTTGICRGEKARELMEKYIHKKTGIPYMTFKELREEIQKGKNYKHFHVFATKLGPNKEILDINSEDPRWDDVIISDGTTASMSIPGVFIPHRLHIKVIGPNGIAQRLPRPENYVLVDGGILHNLALESFDRKRYFTDNYTEENKDEPIFNSRVLGLSLFDPSEKLSQPDKEIKNIGEFLWNITQIYLQAEDLIKNLNPHNKKRIIDINSLGISTLKFNLSEREKTNLVDSGLSGVRNFIQLKLEQFEFDPLPVSEDKLFEENLYHQKIDIECSKRLINRTPSFSGLFMLGTCENLTCRQWNEEQSIPLIIKEGRADITRSLHNFKCFCCNDSFASLKEIALLNCACEVNYGDEDGEHTLALSTIGLEATIIKWKQIPIYMHFEKIENTK